MNTAAPLEDGDIWRIAVFRALGLGDLLCATPVLRALKAAWPAAELTLIGLPWARELAARWGYVDRFEPFPGYPGLPEREPDTAALPGFIARMQRARYDLLVQLHGSGRITNPLLATFGARHLAGHREPDGWCAEPARHADWPEHGHEIERLLQVVDLLGIARCGTRLDFPIDDDDRARLACTWPMLVRDNVRYACVHAGAQLASRRWVPERFAAVADALADRGYRVVLTGGPGEAALAARIRTAMQADAIDACGRTDLGLLGALIERARLLVSNDTGVSHVAAALGTRSVVVSCGADTTRWAPLDTQRHRVLWHDVPCRPCLHRTCPIGHPCAWGVGSADVIETALAMADDAAPVRGLAASR
ncbi:MAG TPA: glycosyltransferase family 9 protein [Burkholderiaceae bacterium]